jgi:hypothetical protein
LRPAVLRGRNSACRKPHSALQLAPRNQACLPRGGAGIPGSRIIYSAARNAVAATAIATQSRRLLAALAFSSDEAACLASLASRRTRLVPGMRTPVCFP